MSYNRNMERRGSREEDLRQEFGENIKIIIGDYASLLNLPASLDIPLPASEDNPNGTQSILYAPESEDLFLVEAGLEENAQPTVTKLEDEDWVRYGPTVSNALIDIKNALNPPQESNSSSPIPQKQ